MTGSTYAIRIPTPTLIDGIAHMVKPPAENIRSQIAAMNSVMFPPPPPSPAEMAFNTIAAEAKAFEESLRDGELVGAMMASFGREVTLQISSISRSGQFIRFDGVSDAGQEVRLIQHFTQTSLLFVKLERPGVQRRPIGFTSFEAVESGSTTSSPR
ncbi:DUF6173 family protein [Paraburkholderia tropica]|uniref:DUF6173 family protein n=1 Tax=Paraburkholderia tropica TaxID=92647 RepID=UPI0011B5D24B|nr:DUF6173 family protein [Paraburkholderia tropica]